MKSELLSQSLWHGFQTDRLYMVYQDAGGGFEATPADGKSSEQVYMPVNRIPYAIVCRTSESTKRIDDGLTATETGKANGVTAYEIVGGGSVVGVSLVVDEGVYSVSYCTPDGAHLVRTNSGQVAAADTDNIVSDFVSHKTLRAFFAGKHGASEQDLFVTAKTRWFRQRLNPKFLGFSKDKV